MGSGAGPNDQFLRFKPQAARQPVPQAKVQAQLFAFSWGQTHVRTDAWHAIDEDEATAVRLCGAADGAPVELMLQLGDVEEAARVTAVYGGVLPATYVPSSGGLSHCRPESVRHGISSWILV